MYAVGHLALGYLSGKTASKILNVSINLPLIFLISVLPDIDLVIPTLHHRGPSHSIVVFSIFFLPAFILFKKKAVPYFVALLQHSLIGDYIIGDSQLLWPVTPNWYGSGLGLKVTSTTNILIEWILFLIAFIVMFKTKDIRLLLQRHPTNMILSIPTITVLLPAFLSFPLYVPSELIIPHLLYIGLFTLSILVDWKAILTKT